MSEDLTSVTSLGQIEGWLKRLIREAVREELQTGTGDDELLTAKQAAALLNFKNVRRVYDLSREKKIPEQRISKNTVRFRRSDVQRYIASGAK
jgi:excisionase family DNA binding protein